MYMYIHIYVYITQARSARLIRWKHTVHGLIAGASSGPAGSINFFLCVGS